MPRSIWNANSDRDWPGTEETIPEGETELEMVYRDLYAARVALKNVLKGQAKADHNRDIALGRACSALRILARDNKLARETMIGIEKLLAPDAEPLDTVHDCPYCECEER